MPEPLVPPEFQYCDANGVPYAGGTITTYVPGTSTFQNTWADMEGTALNANPIVLDAAGRALIYGSGEYRFVLRDAAGNLIYDQETTSFISDAMKSVVQAASISDAQTLLGIDSSVQTETDRATSAESALTADINAEIARAEAAENKLAAQLGPGGVVGSPGTANAFFIQGGESATDSTGHIRLTFPVAYATHPSVYVQVINPSGNTVAVTATVGYPDATGVDIYTSSDGAAFGCGFSWFAWGD